MLSEKMVRCSTDKEITVAPIYGGSEISVPVGTEAMTIRDVKQQVLEMLGVPMDLQSLTTHSSNSPLCDDQLIGTDGNNRLILTTTLKGGASGGIRTVETMPDMCNIHVCCFRGNKECIRATSTSFIFLVRWLAELPPRRG